MRSGASPRRRVRPPRRSRGKAVRAAGVVLVTLAALAAPAAAEFRSVEAPAAVLYDAPSRAAKPVAVVSRHYPVELVVVTEGWVKVRDHTGALSWLERRLLAERRTVLVTAASAPVRERPEDAAPVVFFAAQNVALERLEAGPVGWLRVRHVDGASGFVRSAAVWGD